MNSPQYRVFVCTKKRSDDNPEGCCCNVGALDVYQAFQTEIDRLELRDRVTIRKSGCLDNCEFGAVAMVYQPQGNEFAWLPTKIRIKLKKLLFPNRIFYGNLTPANVKAIAQSHFIEGKIVKKHQIFTK